MLRNQSVPVSTVDNIEFVNLTESDISPLVSKCEIKVMYVGKNRNGSYMDKSTATKMAKSLRMTPIVGAYRKDVEDFGDHGDVIHIEDGEVKFSCKTVPYGFVAPDAHVWFQKFKDTNDFGEEIEREYLMTTGYLWTGQFPEIEKCINEGQGQSMEIDNVDGHWTNDAEGMEFFIINDAIFTKLCVLGDDVEPCFEGASITSPEVSQSFSLAGSEFSHTLFAMMNEMKNALNDEGGSNMPAKSDVIENVETEEVSATLGEEIAEVEIQETEEVAEVEDVEVTEDAGDEAAESFAKDDKKDVEDVSADDSEDDSDKSDSSDSSDSNDDKSAEEKKKNSLENEVSKLSNQLKELTDKFAVLEDEAKKLRAFKADRINADKDALIGKYHMLSDEDKADIVANKDKFSLSEIESKLALLYVQRNVDFDSVDGRVEMPVAEPLTTFSLEDDECAEDADPILSALREAKNY